MPTLEEFSRGVTTDSAPPQNVSLADFASRGTQAKTEEPGFFGKVGEAVKSVTLTPLARAQKAVSEFTSQKFTNALQGKYAEAFWTNPFVQSRFGSLLPDQTQKIVSALERNESFLKKGVVAPFTLTATGGLVDPAVGPPTTTAEKISSEVFGTLGTIAGIVTASRALGVLAGSNAALASFAKAHPYISSYLKMVGGFTVYDQLNPELGDSVRARLGAASKSTINASLLFPIGFLPGIKKISVGKGKGFIPIPVASTAAGTLGATLSYIENPDAPATEHFKSGAVFAAIDLAGRGHISWKSARETVKDFGKRRLADPNLPIRVRSGIKKVLGIVEEDTIVEGRRLLVPEVSAPNVLETLKSREFRDFARQYNRVGVAQREGRELNARDATFAEQVARTMESLARKGVESPRPVDIFTEIKSIERPRAFADIVERVPELKKTAENLETRTTEVKPKQKPPEEAVRPEEAGKPKDEISNLRGELDILERRIDETSGKEREKVIERSNAARDRLNKFVEEKQEVIKVGDHKKGSFEIKLIEFPDGAFGFGVDVLVASAGFGSPVLGGPYYSSRSAAVRAGVEEVRRWLNNQIVRQDATTAQKQQIKHLFKELVGVESQSLPIDVLRDIAKFEKKLAELGDDVSATIRSTRDRSSPEEYRNFLEYFLYEGGKNSRSRASFNEDLNEDGVVRPKTQSEYEIGFEESVKGNVKFDAEKQEFKKAEDPLRDKPVEETGNLLGKEYEINKELASRLGISSRAKQGKIVKEKTLRGGKTEEDVALSLVRLGSAKKSSLPVLGNVAFNGKDVISTDLENFVVYRGSRDFGKGTIPASVLKNKSLRDVEFIGTEKEVKARVGQTEVMGTPVEEFPELPKIEKVADGKVSYSRDYGKELLNSTASESFRPELNGVYVSSDGKKITFASTDGFRLTQRAVEGQTTPFTVVLNKKAVEILNKVIESGVPAQSIGVEIGKDYSRLSVGNFDVYAKSTDGKFPEYKAIIPDQVVGRSLRVDVADLKVLLRAAGPSLGKTNKEVDLTFEKDGTRVSAKNETSSFDEKIPLIGKQGTYQVGKDSNVILLMPIKDGPAGGVRVNAEYLKDTIKNASFDKVEILVPSENDKAIIIRSYGGDAKEVIKNSVREYGVEAESEMQTPTSERKTPQVNIFAREVGGFYTHSATISSPGDVADLMRSLRTKGEENGYAVNLDGNGNVLGVHRFGVGGVDQLLANPRDVFRSTLLTDAKRVYVVHNHTSGDHRPSAHDLVNAKALAEFAKKVGITFEGGIVTDGDYYSFVTPEGKSVPVRHKYIESTKVRIPEIELVRNPIVLKEAVSAANRNEVFQIVKEFSDPKVESITSIPVSATLQANDVKYLANDFREPAELLRRAMEDTVKSNSTGIILATNFDINRPEIKKVVDHLQERLGENGIELVEVIYTNPQNPKDFYSYKGTGLLKSSEQRNIRKAFGEEEFKFELSPQENEVVRRVSAGEKLDASLSEAVKSLERRGLISETQPETPASKRQKIIAGKIARAKGLSESQQKRLKKRLTGKSSMNQMTTEEAQKYIEALRGVVKPFGGKPVIPTGKKLITEEFGEPPPEHVFQDLFGKFYKPGRERLPGILGKKVGGDLVRAYDAMKEFVGVGIREIRGWRDLLGISRLKTTFTVSGRKASNEQSRRLFDAVDEGKIEGLKDPREREVALRFKKMANEIADAVDSARAKLGLESMDRKKNYITNLITETARVMVEERSDSREPLYAILRSQIPKQVFDKLLLERKGNLPIQRDFWKAARVMLQVHSKYIFYSQPIAQANAYLKLWSGRMPQRAVDYVNDQIQRVFLNRPHKLESWLRAVDAAITKTASKNIPGWNKTETIEYSNGIKEIINIPKYNLRIFQRAVPLIRGVNYMATLGLSIPFFMLNLTQPFIYAPPKLRGGFVNAYSSFFKGYGRMLLDLFRPSRWEYWRQRGVLNEVDSLIQEEFGSRGILSDTLLVVGKVSEFMNRVATTAAFEENVIKLSKQGKLDKLMPEIQKRLDEAGFKEETQELAKQFSDIVNYRYGPLDTPPAFLNPIGQLYYQYNSFAIKTFNLLNETRVNANLRKEVPALLKAIQRGEGYKYIAEVSQDKRGELLRFTVHFAALWPILTALGVSAFELIGKSVVPNQIEGIQKVLNGWLKDDEDLVNEGLRDIAVPPSLDPFLSSEDIKNLRFLPGQKLIPQAEALKVVKTGELRTREGALKERVDRGEAIKRFLFGGRAEGNVKLNEAVEFVIDLEDEKTRRIDEIARDTLSGGKGAGDEVTKWNSEVVKKAKEFQEKYGKPLPARKYVITSDNIRNRIEGVSEAENIPTLERRLYR